MLPLLRLYFQFSFFPPCHSSWQYCRSVLRVALFSVQSHSPTSVGLLLYTLTECSRLCIWVVIYLTTFSVSQIPLRRMIGSCNECLVGVKKSGRGLIWGAGGTEETIEDGQYSGQDLNHTHPRYE
jgi:hypothetical protein